MLYGREDFNEHKERMMELSKTLGPKLADRLNETIGKWIEEDLKTYSTTDELPPPVMMGLISYAANRLVADSMLMTLTSPEMIPGLEMAYGNLLRILVIKYLSGGAYEGMVMERLGPDSKVTREDVQKALSGGLVGWLMEDKKAQEAAEMVLSPKGPLQ